LKAGRFARLILCPDLNRVLRREPAMHPSGSPPSPIDSFN
jgi:hypothetical protein